MARLPGTGLQSLCRLAVDRERGNVRKIGPTSLLLNERKSMDLNSIDDFRKYIEENNKSLPKGEKVSYLIEEVKIDEPCTFNFDVELISLKTLFPKCTIFSFIGSTFTRPVLFYPSYKIDYHLHFDSCHFLSKVDFREIKFLRDIDFIKSTFHEDVIFFKIVFHEHFRLFGSTFQNVTFAYLALNEKFILFTGRDDRTIFKGNVYFQNVDFHEAKFWDFYFPKDVTFQDASFYCTTFFNRSKFLGLTTFISTESLGSSKFLKRVYFNDAEISNLSLQDLTIENVIFFSKATIKQILIKNVYCDGAFLSFDGTTIDHIADESTARFIKTEAIKSNNPFLFSESVAREMNLHYKRLSWNRDFFDKLILFLNKNSTDFGEKWYQGVAFILISWVLSFSLIIRLRDGYKEPFIWCNKEYLKEAINFLWQFGNLDVLGDSFDMLSIIIFIFGKILIIYGVYQTITAFRKYGKR